MPAGSTQRPRLTCDLPGRRRPLVCQSCDRTTQVYAWQEHDDRDRPLPVYVLLCQECAARVVEPHPRLYDRRPANEPIHGAMPLCVDCLHRRGLRCHCPDAKRNGGPGITITRPKPHVVHVCYERQGGGRGGEWIRMYPGPATNCSGRLVKEGGHAT